MTAMAKHDDQAMTWYNHGDSYSPWHDHGIFHYGHDMIIQYSMMTMS